MRSVLQSVQTRAWLVRRPALYLIISAIGNLVWEAIQTPLYTIWRTGTWREIFVTVAHCTGGDVLIATATLLFVALSGSDGSDYFQMKTLPRGGAELALHAFAHNLTRVINIWDRAGGDRSRPIGLDLAKLASPNKPNKLIPFGVR
jgi:hypothetical protein